LAPHQPAAIEVHEKNAPITILYTPHSFSAQEANVLFIENTVSELADLALVIAYMPRLDPANCFVKNANFGTHGLAYRPNSACRIRLIAGRP